MKIKHYFKEMVYGIVLFEPKYARKWQQNMFDVRYVPTTDLYSGSYQFVYMLNQTLTLVNICSSFNILESIVMTHLTNNTAKTTFAVIA